MRNGTVESKSRSSRMTGNSCQIVKEGLPTSMISPCQEGNPGVRRLRSERVERELLDGGDGVQLSAVITRRRTLRSSSAELWRPRLAVD